MILVLQFVSRLLLQLIKRAFLFDDSDIYFGVVKAVNEFILSREDYEVKYLTLESGMYNTIVIRKINGTER